MKNVSKRENKSTIGVMSMCGDLVGNLIFGISYIIYANIKTQLSLVLCEHSITF